VTGMHRGAARVGVIGLPEVLAPEVALTVVLSAGTPGGNLYGDSRTRARRWAPTPGT
jgi:hypothetical protein